MLLFINSLKLAPLVAWRMILPSIGIVIVAAWVWFCLGILTLGLSSYVSDAGTAAFFTLIGIRMALSIKGDDSLTDHKLIVRYSVAYGIVLSFAKVAMVLVGISVIAISGNFGTLNISAYLGGTISAEAMMLSAIARIGPITSILILVPFLVAVPIFFAVPMAAIARSCGKGSPSSSIFWGVGKSAVPLALIFIISYALQFFFEFFTLIYVTLPTLLYILAAALNSEQLPSFNLEAILKGIFFFAGLLISHAWLWSAAALALLKAEDQDKSQKTAVQAATTIDLRSLRKSRDQNRR